MFFKIAIESPIFVKQTSVNIIFSHGEHTKARFPRDTPAGYRTVRISWILVFRAYSNGTAATAYMPHGTTERGKEGRVVLHVNYKAGGR